MHKRDDVDFGQSRAILIGAETYEAGFGDRQPVPAGRSLREMRELLTEACEWPADRVETVMDPRDSGRLLRRMADLIEDVSDVLIFYYVGHGQLLVGGDRHDLGLAMTDTSEDPAHRRLTSLQFREVRGLIDRNSSARIKIFILDCCCSGIATKYGEPGSGSEAKMGNAHPTHGAGTYVWSACGHSDEAFFEPGKSGLTYFTKFLAQAVREAHEGAPPGATIQDLHLAVKADLAEVGQQVPRLVYSGEPDQSLFVVGRKPAFEFRPLQPRDPRTIGSYSLKAGLGGGGVGRVFLAFTDNGKPAAVKLLRAELGQDPKARERFGREIRVAQGVHSRFVARVLGSDSNAPDPWLACEYVCGPSLLDLVREVGPLATSEVLAIGAGIAKGLEDIHKAGAIHRDLKPVNVMLDEHGPKIVDFGVAKAVGATQITQSNAQLGTAAYKSPEQATGRTVTARSDVFSLGSTLYYLATGNVLFNAEEPIGVIYQIAHEEPDLDALDPDLRPLVQSCLAKNPADRPAPARIVEICADLIGAPTAPEIADKIPSATPLIQARMRALRSLERSFAHDPVDTPEPPQKQDNSDDDTIEVDGTPPKKRPPKTQQPSANKRAATGIVAVIATLICVFAVVAAQGLNRSTAQRGSGAGASSAPSTSTSSSQPPETQPSSVPSTSFSPFTPTLRPDPPTPSPSDTPTPDLMQSAQIGDCFTIGASYTNPNLQPADCAPQTFEVVRILPNTTDHGGCSDAPNDDFNVSNSKDDMVLCLTYHLPNTGPYHARPNTCVFGPNVDHTVWNSVSCNIGNFTVLKRVVGNTDKSQCNGLPGWNDTETIRTPWNQLNVMLCLAMNFPPEGTASIGSCMYKTGSGSNADFQSVPCSQANVVVTNRITGQYMDAGFCKPDAWTSWHPTGFPLMTYTTCFHAYP